MLPPPLNKFSLFAAFFLVGKDLMRQKGVRLARNKRKRLEIKQIKKNAHVEPLVQEKKKRQTTEEKLSSAKKFTCKFT